MNTDIRSSMFYQFIIAMLNGEKNFANNFATTIKHNSVIAMLSAIIAIATNTKANDGDLSMVISGIKKLAGQLGISSRFWVMDALKVLEARMNGDDVCENDLMSHHNTVIAVMKNIGAAGDIIASFDQSEATFLFLCALITQSDVPKDEIRNVIMNVSGEAKRLGFDGHDAFKSAVRSLEERMAMLGSCDKDSVVADHNAESVAA